MLVWHGVHQQLPFAGTDQQPSTCRGKCRCEVKPTRSVRWEEGGGGAEHVAAAAEVE